LSDLSTHIYKEIKTEYLSTTREIIDIANTSDYVEAIACFTLERYVCWLKILVIYLVVKSIHVSDCKGESNDRNCDDYKC
jgi:hypothetical protein